MSAEPIPYRAHGAGTGLDKARTAKRANWSAERRGGRPRKYPDASEGQRDASKRQLYVGNRPADKPTVVCPWRWLSTTVAVHAERGERLTIESLRRKGGMPATERRAAFVLVELHARDGWARAARIKLEQEPSWNFADLVVVALIAAGWEEP